MFPFLITIEAAAGSDGTILMYYNCAESVLLRGSEMARDLSLDFECQDRGDQ
jgi:hypothetical protein